MTNKLGHHWNVRSRREFFQAAGSGLAGLALSSMLQAETPDPLSKKPGHYAAKAKSVIWCFMEGGPSHLDLFDPKPKLDELSGQPMPESFGKPITAMGTANNTLMGTKRQLEAARPELDCGFPIGIRTSRNTSMIWL